MYDGYARTDDFERSFFYFDLFLYATRYDNFHSVFGLWSDFVTNISEYVVDCCPK